MKIVEIYKTNIDGHQDKIAIFKLTDESSVALGEGDSSLIKEITEYGINDYTNKSGRRLFPQDGIIFLTNLKFAFKSGYLMASEILDIDSVSK